MSGSLALVKASQKSFSKKVNSVQRKLKSGTITIKEKPKGKKRFKQERGVVYLSHIPHGFYEEEMRSYFKQFGKVTNVKVCRSKKTGRSKGYAFVEFLNPEVAKIAAETMHNYLMFKKRLVAEYIPPEKQKRGIFSKNPITPDNIPGVNQRQKEIAKKNENTDDDEDDQARKLLTQFQKKLDKLKKLGIEHDLKPVGDYSKFVPLKNDISDIASDTDNSFYYETVDSDIDVKVAKGSEKGKGSAKKNTSKKMTKTKNTPKLSKRNIKS